MDVLRCTNCQKKDLDSFPKKKRDKLTGPQLICCHTLGFLSECDRYYQEEIHNSTKDFPMCPENIDITYDMLSPFKKMCLRNVYVRQSYKQKKLTASFLPRKQM